MMTQLDDETDAVLRGVMPLNVLHNLRDNRGICLMTIFTCPLWQSFISLRDFFSGLAAGLNLSLFLSCVWLMMITL